MTTAGIKDIRGASGRFHKSHDSCYESHSVYIGAVLRQVVEGGQVSVHCQSISYLVCLLASVNACDSSPPLFVTHLTPRRYRCYSCRAKNYYGLHLGLLDPSGPKGLYRRSTPG